MSQDTNLRKSYPVVVGPDGTATAVIAPTGGVPWNVTQVSAAILSAPPAAFAMSRVNGAFYSYFLPAGDVLAGEPPLLLQPGDVLTMEWSDCTPGQAGTVLVQYDRVGYQ